ncbi:MAG: hypothetical protein ACE5EJ_06160, partial [Nitrosopumilaceae archaeon]
MAQVAEGLVRIRYRFQEETKFVTVRVTESQYHNLLDLPIIEKCEI